MFLKISKNDKNNPKFFSIRQKYTYKFEEKKIKSKKTKPKNLKNQGSHPLAIWGWPSQYYYLLFSKMTTIFVFFCL
jgi:hypothetical protein